MTSSGGGKVGKRLKEKLTEAGVLGDVQEEEFGEEYELVSYPHGERVGGWDGADGRLRWLIQGSIGVFKILCLRRLKGMGRWKC